MFSQLYYWPLMMFLLVLLGVVTMMVTVVVASPTASCTDGGTSAVIAHPTQCAQYYNCSGSATRWWWEDHLQECPYPQLFSESGSRCEHFSLVTCDQRREPIEACDYRVNQCERAHCVGCRRRGPSCKGLPDGINSPKEVEGSTTYILCKSQRVVYYGDFGEANL